MSNKIPIVYEATKEDSWKLKKLRCLLVKENPLIFGDSPETECSKPISEYSDWINEYNSSNGAIFLLEIYNIAIGMAAIKRYRDADPDIAYMGSLGVLREYQGRGYGRRLLDTRLKYARERGFKVIKTITTKENTKMIDILKKYGFKITGEGTYKGIPEYTLEIVL